MSKTSRSFVAFQALATVWGWMRRAKAFWKFIFALLILYGITAPNQGELTSAIFDDAQLLSSAEETALLAELEALSAGVEVRFLVVTASDVPLERLPVTADKALGRLGEGRSWVMELLRPSAGNAVLLYYSERPKLLQIRYGRSLRARARVAGIEYGDGYARIAREGTGANGTLMLGAAARAASEELATVEGLLFVQEMATQVLTLIDGEVLQLLLTPDFDIWRGVARRVSAPVVIWLGGFIDGPFVFMLVFGCAIPLIRALLMLVAMMPALLLWFGPQRGRFGDMPGCVSTIFGFGVVWAGQLAFAVAAWAALGLILITAAGRTEDVLMLGALGLDPTDLPEFPQRLGAGILITLASLVFALRALRSLADALKESRRGTAKRLETFQKMVGDGESFEQIEGQVLTEAAEEWEKNAAKRKRTALWKGAVGAGLICVVPGWAAIFLAAFGLAYELVPIRFGSPD